MFQFTTPVYLVRDPQLIKKLTVKDFDYFMDHSVVISDDVDDLFGKALISLTGQKWKGKLTTLSKFKLIIVININFLIQLDMRSTLSPAFTGSKMRKMFDFVAVVSRQTADSIKQEMRTGTGISKEFEFKDLAMKFTVDNIASCAFGIEVNSFKNPDNHFQMVAKDFANIGSFKNVLKFAGYLLVPSIMKLLQIKFFDKRVDVFFQHAILDTIKVREEKGIIRHDMINLLIQAKKGG